MFNPGSYLGFLLRSTNHHGVHSPFVYAYLTRCLYRKSRGHLEKLKKIALKSIPYFNYKSAQLITRDREFGPALKREFPALAFDQPPYDLVVIDRGMLNQFDFNTLLRHCHNKSMILIGGIRATRKDRALWDSLCADPRIRVSIDFYFGGILFLREEQEKQHFRIRI